MLKLYNTETRRIDTFTPIEQGKVGLYTCGPTVYHFAHIGNLRTYVFEDLLKRVLKRAGYEVTHVMNITDVGHLTDDADAGEDKMEVGASREGRSVWDIALFYTQAFREDMNKLRIEEPTIWCRATDHIKEQIEWVAKMEEMGCVYKAEDGLYFNTAKFETYGHMAGLDLEGQQAGIRVAQAEGKKNSNDFAVWKFSPQGQKRQMEWDSPWGKGFPGWHLECTAMALKYLGEEIDIHCGGVDHVRVHHTNEIAQTECVTHKKWVRWWMHGEFLLMDEEGKMSKSADNFLTVSELERKGFDPLAYRLFLLGAHYRKAMKFNFKALESSQIALNRLRTRAAQLPAPKAGLEDAGFVQAFNEACFSDLNIPKALSIMWNLLHDENISPESKSSTLKNMDEILQIHPFAGEKKAFLEIDEKEDAEIRSLIEARIQARAEKNFVEADRIRDELLKRNIEIKDSVQGTEYSKKTLV